MAYNRKVNLAKLLESLDLDFDDDDAGVVDMTDRKDEQPLFKKDQIQSRDIFTLLVEKRFLNNDSSDLNILEKNLIKDINENPEKYEGKYRVENYKDLRKVLYNSIKYLGQTGNYNWIDTVNVTSLQRLFMNLY